MNNDTKELVDYFDKSGSIIGTCTRKEADDNNYIYPNVIVFIFTPDGRVWIQKRSLQKRHYPGIWDTSACGALAHDENPKIAAQRELMEEMNIACELTLVEKFINVFPSEDKSFERSRMSFIFIGTSDKIPSGNEEVEAVAAWDIEDLLEEITKNPDGFVPSFDIEIEKALKGYDKL